MLFVTHATNVAREFCSRGLLMKNGKLIFDGNIDEAIEQYNSTISTLNSKAETYLNRTYATSARCVGSVPDNPSYESDIDSPGSLNMSGLRNPDSNYITDTKQLRTLGILMTDDEYWLASRSSPYFGGSAEEYNEHQGMRYVHDIDSGYSESEAVEDSAMSIGNNDGDGSIEVANGGSYGLRPVFTLKPTVMVVGGSGTADDPYILGV